MIDWITFDIGKAWHENYRVELAETIIKDFTELQNIYWDSKPSKDKYFIIITGWFHDGNLDCIFLRKNVKNIDNNWYTFYRLFKYLQWSYMYMEIRGLLK